MGLFDIGLVEEIRTGQKDLLDILEKILAELKRINGKNVSNDEQL